MSINFTKWYSRDASWQASIGRAGKLHLPRPDDEALAMCSDIIAIVETPYEKPPVYMQCKRCLKLQKKGERMTEHDFKTLTRLIAENEFEVQSAIITKRGHEAVLRDVIDMWIGRMMREKNMSFGDACEVVRDFVSAECPE